MSKNIILTERDIGVLKSLYDNVVMTFSQLARSHFSNVAKPTAINRLSRLEKAGFISRERIPRMTLGLDERAIGVIFQITRRGIFELRNRQFGAIAKADPIKIHPYSLHHDLVLVDLKEALEVRFGSQSMTNGKYVNGLSGLGIEPDLIGSVPGIGKVAVELELTDKAERRYQEIILRYRLAKDIARVVYVTPDPYIRRLISKVIVGREIHPSERPSTGKFYFADLHTIINNPNQAEIASGTELWEKGGKNYGQTTHAQLDR